MADKVAAKANLDSLVAEFLNKGGKIVVNEGTLRKRARNAKHKELKDMSNSIVSYHKGERNNGFFD